LYTHYNLSSLRTALPPLKDAKARPQIGKPFKQSSPGKEVWNRNILYYVAMELWFVAMN
jgi:hypothetical protein